METIVHVSYKHLSLTMKKIIVMQPIPVGTLQPAIKQQRRTVAKTLSLDEIRARHYDVKWVVDDDGDIDIHERGKTIVFTTGPSVLLIAIKFSQTTATTWDRFWGNNSQIIVPY